MSYASVGATATMRVHTGAWRIPVIISSGRPMVVMNKHHGVAAAAGVQQLGELRDVGLLPPGSPGSTMNAAPTAPEW